MVAWCCQPWRIGKSHCQPLRAVLHSRLFFTRAAIKSDWPPSDPSHQRSPSPSRPSDWTPSWVTCAFHVLRCLRSLVWPHTHTPLQCCLRGVTTPLLSQSLLFPLVWRQGRNPWTSCVFCVLHTHVGKHTSALPCSISHDLFSLKWWEYKKKDAREEVRRAETNKKHSLAPLYIFNLPTIYLKGSLTDSYIIETTPTVWFIQHTSFARPFLSIDECGWMDRRDFTGAIWTVSL